jgi:ATP-dependent helicase/nuclease subunit A
LSQRRDPFLLWEAMADPQRLARCTPEDFINLTRVRRTLEQAFLTRNSIPLADWLELTWLRLGAADAYPADELRHARAFFAALSERVAGGEWSGPQDLDSLLADLFAQPQASAANPVQLMTIHRAKGLEFDHVFVPSLERELNRGREPLLRWLDLPRADGESDLIMAPVPTIGDDEGGEVSAYVKRLTSRRAQNEQVRLIYVAATRAKQTLEFSAAPKAKNDGTIAPRHGTLLAALWPAVEHDATADLLSRALAKSMTATPGTSGAGTSGATGAATSATSDEPPPKPIRRLLTSWSLPNLVSATQLPHLPVAHQSLEPPEFSWVGETARHIGTVVHAGLESYATRQPLPTRAQIEADHSFYMYQLRRHGVPERDLPYATAMVIDALARTVDNDRGRWIFAPEHREAQSEWALTGIAAGRLANVVIDRSFVDETGTRWVIDFKTSRHEGGGLDAFLEQEMTRYRPQLESYVALARGISDAPVRAGLYFPLLDVFRELEP